MDRRDSGHAEQQMLKSEMPVRRKRGRPQRRFMDEVKDDMEIGWSEMEADDLLKKKKKKFVPVKKLNHFKKKLHTDNFS